MNSIFSPSSVHLPSPRWHCTPCLQVQAHNFCQDCHHRRGLQISLSFPFISQIPLRAQKFSTGATVPPNEGAISVIDFEDFVEKDWSFLDSDDLMSRDDCNKNIDRIISAGRIEETSKVLVSIGSEGFVDRLVDSSPCNLLLIVHDSLLLLACIKEKYDKVKCWQGELPHVPEKWAPIDVVFLYFLPALPFKLDQIFGALAKRCSPGARVVISHPQGREVLKQQREQYPDVIVSDLPDKTTLQKATSDHSFDTVEFVDEPGLYLAVLTFSKAIN